MTSYTFLKYSGIFPEEMGKGGGLYEFEFSTEPEDISILCEVTMLGRTLKAQCIYMHEEDGVRDLSPLEIEEFNSMIEEELNDDEAYYLEKLMGFEPWEISRYSNN